MKSFSEHLVAAEFSPVGITPVFDPDHRVRVFGSLDEIAAAGFPANGFVYRAAAKQYSQSNHIGNLYVGWKIPEGVYDVGVRIIGEWKPGNYLSVTVSGVTLDTIYYDEMGGADAMIDRLVKEFNAEIKDAQAIKVSATELRVYGALKNSTVEIEGGTEKPALAWFDRVSGKINPGMDFDPYPADENWTKALDAMKARNNDWYALSVSTRQMAGQQECAQWIQANEKLGCLCSGDSAITDAETGDIAAWAKLNNLDRVFVFFHPDAKLADAAVDALAPADPVPEAAYFGKMLTKQPGSATWKFKELQGVPTYELTQGQVSSVESKNATWYMTAAGVPMTSNGQVASGEYIDVIHGLDWLKARIQNLVFTALVNVDKVPFTDAGVQMVVSPLKAALEEGKKNGILASYEISFPAVADVSVTDKGRRFLPDVNFTGVLAGAIHGTKINGVVTL
jgi:hypothetical protein